MKHLSTEFSANYDQPDNDFSYKFILYANLNESKSRSHQAITAAARTACVTCSNIELLLTVRSV